MSNEIARTIGGCWRKFDLANPQSQLFAEALRRATVDLVNIDIEIETLRLKRERMTKPYENLLGRP